MNATRARKRTQAVAKAKRTRLEKVVLFNLAFLSFIWGLFRYWSEVTFVTTYLTYLPTILWALPTIVLLPVSLWSRQKQAIWGSVVAALFSLHLMGFSVPSPFPLDPFEGYEIKVMTFNIRHAESGWEGVRDVVLERNPDIVCFQEADNRTHSGSAIGPLPGYQVEYRNGLAIAAKARPTNVRTVQLALGSPPALEARVGEVTVVNVQLTSYRSVASPRNVGAVAGIHQVQIETLTTMYGKARDCIVAGDFNTPPRGDNFQSLNDTFDDAFGHKGWGFGYTYPSHFPLERIDYAFVKDLIPLSAEVVATTVSDHRPVFFTMLVHRPT